MPMYRYNHKGSAKGISRKYGQILNVAYMSSQQQDSAEQKSLKRLD